LSSSTENQNGTVHRAAVNDFDFIKTRDPRLRVQRFVIACLVVILVPS